MRLSGDVAMYCSTSWTYLFSCVARLRAIVSCAVGKLSLFVLGLFVLWVGMIVSRAASLAHCAVAV